MAYKMKVTFNSSNQKLEPASNRPLTGHMVKVKEQSEALMREKLLLSKPNEGRTSL